MKNPFSRLHQKILVLVCALIAFALILISVLVLASQFSEASSKNEMLSLTSFAVILTFSGLAFNWCRVPLDFASPGLLHQVYHTGIQLFLSSLLALVASFLIWFQTSLETSTPWMSKACQLLHWTFISLSIVFFLIAMLRLLAAIVKESSHAR
jgi:hypothetical protein